MCVALIIEISKRRTLNNHECLPKPHEWRTNQTQPNDHSQRQTSKYRSVKMLGYEKQMVHHKWVTTEGVLRLDVCVDYVCSWDECVFVMLFLPQPTATSRAVLSTVISLGSHLSESWHRGLCVRSTPKPPFILLRTAHIGVIAPHISGLSCALFVEPQHLVNFRTGIASLAHIGILAPLCDKNLTGLRFEKATAQRAKTPMIAVVCSMNCRG